MSQIPRLFINTSEVFSNDKLVELEGNSHHYLAHVLRKKSGDVAHVFNGASGEWEAEIISVAKKNMTLKLTAERRAFMASPDIWLLFAPVKNEKIDMIARRATELGVAALQPVQTKNTIVSRVNEERLLANMVEAAEQSERLDVPELKPYLRLEQLLSNWDKSRKLFYADESGAAKPASEVLSALPRGQKAAVLIGPEGGFSKEEHGFLSKSDYITGFTMGPRILRAETAALVALAYMQAWLGDGNAAPRFVAE